jgi:hypothetical protein
MDIEDKINKYLKESSMNSQQRNLFHDVASEFMHDNYKTSFKNMSNEQFMKEMEKYDYKALSNLFHKLHIGSIEEFIKKYSDEIEEIKQ